MLLTIRVCSPAHLYHRTPLAPFCPPISSLYATYIRYTLYAIRLRYTLHIYATRYTLHATHYTLHTTPTHYTYTLHLHTTHYTLHTTLPLYWNRKSSLKVFLDLLCDSITIYISNSFLSIFALLFNK